MLKNGDNLSGQIEKNVGDVASCTEKSKIISLGRGARDLGHARTSVCAFARALPETSPFCARGRSRAALAHLKFRVRAQQRAGARVRARRRARPSWRLAYSIGRLALPSVRLVSEADGRGRNASRCVPWLRATTNLVCPRSGFKPRRNEPVRPARLRGRPCWGPAQSDRCASGAPRPPVLCYCGLHTSSANPTWP